MRLIVAFLVIVGLCMAQTKATQHKKRKTTTPFFSAGVTLPSKKQVANSMLWRNGYSSFLSTNDVVGPKKDVLYALPKGSVDPFHDALHNDGNWSKDFPWNSLIYRGTESFTLKEDHSFHVTSFKQPDGRAYAVEINQPQALFERIIFHPSQYFFRKVFHDMIGSPWQRKVEPIPQDQPVQK